MYRAPANLLRALVLGILFTAAVPAYAATLSFTNPSGTVGQTVSVSVLVGAQDGQPLNGVSTRIEFPTDKLTLLSLSKVGSIITFWAEEPSFSNAAGSASVEGIIPNPGYSGREGRVITLVFQVKAPGAATLTFSGASVLANDGRGTNILTNAIPRTLTLSAAPQVQPAPPAQSVAPVRQPAVTNPSTAAQPPVVTTTSGQEEMVPVAVTVQDEVVGSKEIFQPPPLVLTIGRAMVLLLAAIGLIALAVAGYLSASRAIIRRREELHSPTVIQRSFGLLKMDIASQLTHLKQETQTPLTEDEIAFLNQFENDLGDVQKIVEARLKQETR